MRAFPIYAQTHKQEKELRGAFVHRTYRCGTRRWLTALQNVTLLSLSAFPPRSDIYVRMLDAYCAHHLKIG